MGLPLLACFIFEGVDFPLYAWFYFCRREFTFVSWFYLCERGFSSVGVVCTSVGVVLPLQACCDFCRRGYNL